MSWQSTLSWQNAQSRADVINSIRQFFLERNVLEVETPLLSNGTITDVHLDAFVSRYDFLVDSAGGHSAPMYLQTSPEFAMKRLLASGYGCIYQIAKAFRHEGYGRYHNPEFTLLEWYRLGFDLYDLMNEVEQFLIAVLNCKQACRVSYQELFLQHISIDPLETTQEELLWVIKQHGKLSDWLTNEHENDILLQFIFSEIIEPKIGLAAPCFVYHFPSSQASLAKINTEDARISERFECYYQGIELANGFHELTDADVQRTRFKRDNAKRQYNNQQEKPLDENFLAALTAGLPPCSGVALGIDRLVMLALNASHIEQVISFPIERA